MKFINSAVKSPPWKRTQLPLHIEKLGSKGGKIEQKKDITKIRKSKGKIGKVLILFTLK